LRKIIYIGQFLFNFCSVLRSHDYHDIVVTSTVQMPVYAVGLTDQETPFTFGASIPPLSFRWSLNKKDVARLQSVFAEVMFHAGVFTRIPAYLSMHKIKFIFIYTNSWHLFQCAIYTSKITKVYYIDYSGHDISVTVFFHLNDHFYYFNLFISVHF